MIKIVDFATTSQGAYRLLRRRAVQFNTVDGEKTGHADAEALRSGEPAESFSNAIICPPGEEVALMREEGLEVIELPLGRALNPFRLPAEIVAFIKILEQLQPDIVHSHNSKAGGVARLALRRWNQRHTERHIVLMHQVHGFVFGKYSGVKRRFFIWVEKLLAGMTDYLLFQNGEELRFAQDAGFGDKGTELLQLGNGISFAELDELSRRISAEPARLAAKPAAPYSIVCVARLEPVKNQTMLIEALGIIRREHPDIDFVCTFIGEGDPAAYASEIQKYQLQDAVRFTGKLSREEIVRQYLLADLNVLTSLTEGMPRALMEAIYLGVPSIGTEVIGTTEVIRPGLSGELVALGDTQGLAGLISALLQDEGRRKALSESGKAYARAHFDEQRVVEKLRGLYRESCRK